jgi:hypothetical protein
MADINPILSNACAIVEGIAFEVIKDKTPIRLLATDLDDPNNIASFIIRERDLILSVSSFREPSREQSLMDAIRINAALLRDEVQYA